MINKKSDLVLQVYISDAAWPKMEILIVSDTGKEYGAAAMYDIAPSQFHVQIVNALRENLAAAIDLAKVKAKAK